MKNYDADFQAEIEKEVAAIFWLIKLEFTNNYLFTDCDIPIYYDGLKYIPIALQVNDIIQNSDFSIESIIIEFPNVELYFSSLLLGEDVGNKPCYIYQSAIDSDNTIIATELIFEGFITAWNLNERRAIITIGNEFMLWRKKTMRLPTDLCAWIFKGSECAYAGFENWCDKTVERCNDLSNYSNFGGRKFIAAIQNKKFYWGPK